MPAAGDVRAPAVSAPAALSLDDDGAAEHADNQPALARVSEAASAAPTVQVEAQAGRSEVRITLAGDNNNKKIII